MVDQGDETYTEWYCSDCEIEKEVEITNRNDLDEETEFSEDHPNTPGYFFGSEGLYWRDHDPEFGRYSGNSGYYDDY